MDDKDANLMTPGKGFVPMMQGGEGSGNFGHEGRPGEVGGSGGGGGSTPSRSASEAKTTLNGLPPMKDLWKDARQNPFPTSPQEINEGDVIRAFDTAKIETVSLESLKTNQESIRGNRVGAMIDLYAEGNKPEAGTIIALQDRIADIYETK